MAAIKLEDLTVTSFFSEEAKQPEPDTEWICTGDISTCSRTSVEGGCDTSVQCVTVPRTACC